MLAFHRGEAGGPALVAALEQVRDAFPAVKYYAVDLDGPKVTAPRPRRAAPAPRHAGEGKAQGQIASTVHASAQGLGQAATEAMAHAVHLPAFRVVRARGFWGV